MRRVRPAVVLALLLAAAELVVAAPVHGGPLPPLNYSIAKSKHGKYKSKAIDGTCPLVSSVGGCTNKQVQNKTVKPGKTATFYVKIKNPSLTNQKVVLHADGSTGGFTVQIVYADDFTDPDLTARATGAGNCAFEGVPAGSKIVVLLKVMNSGASPGSDAFFGIGQYDGTCATPNERNFAHVTGG